MKIITIYIVLLFLALTNSLSAGAAFTISEIDTTEYPYASVYFSAFENNFIEFKDLTPADFVVKENGKIIPEKDVIVDCESDTAILNVVLVLDQSASMDSVVDGRRKWDWVKEGAQEFIDFVGEYDSVFVAITAFAGESKIKCNFTNKAEELRDSLNKITSITSITNFNKAFLQPETGALELLKTRPANQRRIIVFLSDGQHSSHSEDLLINKITETHLANNIQLFSITFMSENNPSLTSISNKTGGRNYDLKQPDKLNDIYKEIAQLVINKTICKLMWLSDIICHSDERFREVEIELLRINRSNITTSYIAPFQSLAFLVSDKIMYYFGNPPANESQTEVITLKGGVNTVRIEDYKIEPNQYFEIVDIGGHGRYIPIDGITLEPEEVIEVTVRFTQGATAVKRNSVIRFYGEPCDLLVEVFGGVQQITLLEPLENQIYSACEDIRISWTGLSPGSAVDVFYQSEDQSSWTRLISEVVETHYLWDIPDETAKYKIKVTESPREVIKWFDNYGGKGNDRILGVVLDSTNSFIYVCGKFGNSLNLQHSNLTAEGGTDAFVAKFDIYGNLIWARSVGSGKDDEAVSLAIDENNNVFVACNITDDPMIGNERFHLHDDTKSYVFIFHYDEDGNLLKYRMFGSIQGNENFEPFAKDIGIFKNNDNYHLKLNGTFIGSYFLAKTFEIISNPNHYPIDFSMYFDNDIQPAQAFSYGLPDDFADTVITDRDGNIYFAGYYDAQDTLISGKRFSTKGEKDFYLQKKGPIPQSSDESGWIEVNRPQLVFNEKFINFGKCTMGDTCEFYSTGVITNTGKIPVEILNVYTFGNNVNDFHVMEGVIGEIVQPGASIDVNFVFTPQVYSDRKTEVIVTGDCGDSISIQLLGSGECGLVAEDIKDLGMATVKDSNVATYAQILYNPTSNPIPFEAILRGVNANEFKVVPNGHLLIMPYEYMEFEVTFKPLSPGKKDAYINFKSLSECKSAQTDLIGEGIKAEMHSDSLAYGDVRLNAGAEGEVHAINFGMDNEEILNINILKNDDNAFDFNIPSTPIAVEPDKSFILDVSFSPTEEKEYSALVEYEIKDREEPLYSLITGKGILPQLDVTFDCGKVVYYGDSAEVTIAVYNKSSETVLKIKEIQILNNDLEYSWKESQPRDLNIDTDAFQYYKIIKAPVKGEDQILQVNVIADNYDGTFEDEWKDNFYEIKCPVPDFEYTNPLDFGNLSVCGLDSLDLVITNTSEGYSLVVFSDDYEITGPDKDAFDIYIQKDFIVRPQESDTLTVYFTPLRSGYHEAHLHIRTAHPENNIEVDLSGIGHLIVPRAEEKVINVLPAGNGIFKFLADIPELNNSYIYDVDIEIQYSPEVLAFDLDGFNSYISDNPDDTEHLLWDVSGGNTVGKIFLKGSGKLAVPFNDALFEIPYMSLLTNNDSSYIKAIINYSCRSYEYDLTLIELADICFEQGRMISVYAEDFALKEADPNPINTGILNLDLSVGFDVETKLNLYDVKGEIVEVFLQQKLNSGEYSFNFDVSKIPTGMYFIEMVAGPYRKTQKIIIID